MDGMRGTGGTGLRGGAGDASRDGAKNAGWGSGGSGFSAGGCERALRAFMLALSPFASRSEDVLATRERLLRGSATEADRGPTARRTPHVKMYAEVRRAVGTYRRTGASCCRSLRDPYARRRGSANATRPRARDPRCFCGRLPRCTRKSCSCVGYRRTC